jgi:hypothetical protein
MQSRCRPPSLSSQRFPPKKLLPPPPVRNRYHSIRHLCERGSIGSWTNCDLFLGIHVAQPKPDQQLPYRCGEHLANLLSTSSIAHDCASSLLTKCPSSSNRRSTKAATRYLLQPGIFIHPKEHLLRQDSMEFAKKMASVPTSRQPLLAETSAMSTILFRRSAEQPVPLIINGHDHERERILIFRCVIYTALRPSISLLTLAGSKGQYERHSTKCCAVSVVTTSIVLPYPTVEPLPQIWCGC